MRTNKSTRPEAVPAAALLSAQSAPSDPARRIVAAAVAGQPDQKGSTRCSSTTPTAVAANNHRGDLRQRSETHFTEQFHRSLRDGAADQLLDSLRPAFEGHAEAIAAAMAVSRRPDPPNNSSPPRNRRPWPPGRI